MHEKLKGWKWKEYQSLGRTQKMILFSPAGCAVGEITFSYDYYYGKKYYSHTWDENGTGGENGVHEESKEPLEVVKSFVEDAIVRQNFHFDCKHNCFDYGDKDEAAALAYDFLKKTCKHDRKAKKEKFKEIIRTMLGPREYERWIRGEF